MKTNQLSPDMQEFLEKASTKAFLTAAQEFVDLLEDKTISPKAFFVKAHRALVDLYSAGYKLERIQLKYSSADSDYDPESLFENKNNDLVSNLGMDALYWTIVDPTYLRKNEQSKSGGAIEHKEADQGWLVDDFLDIYRDLKIELTKIEGIRTDEAVDDLWQLKWGFFHHWGEHCIDALRYFHYLYYEGKDAL